MWGEELAGSVNQHVVQLRFELIPVGCPEVPPYPIKLRSQGLDPSGPIDRDSALGHFPCVAHPWVKTRLGLETVEGRAGDPAEPAGGGGGYRETDAANASDFEAKIAGGGSEPCCEFPWPVNLAELSTDFGQRGLRVLDLSWC